MSRPLARTLGVLAALSLAAAGPAAVFDLAYIRDASSLETRTLEDWHEVPGAVPSRQKLEEITVCEWWPGKKIRVPVILVAPAGRPAQGFIVANMSFRTRHIKLGPLHRYLLPRGVGFVHVAIDRLDRMEPGGRLQKAANEMLLKTRSVRYTGPWLWGITYMRAVTAALHESADFRGPKIAATGGSKRGMAAAVAALHDDRFTAIAPIVAPAMELPAALTRGGEEPSPEIAEADARFWKDAAAGRTPLTEIQIQNLRRQQQRMRNMGPTPDQMRGAGWSPEQIRAFTRALERLCLIGRHPELMRKPRFEFFYQFGSNDNVSPGLRRLAIAWPSFPAYIVPGGQHGIDGLGWRRRVPTLPEVRANLIAFFSNHFFGDRPLMRTPEIAWDQAEGKLTVTVKFASGPPPHESTLHWSYDRAPVGSLPYTYSEWRSMPMRRTGPREWAADAPVPGDVKWIDVLTTHRDDINGLPFHVSSPYLRIPARVRLIEDLPYRQGVSTAWKLDLALPLERTNALRPALVFVHGGGWRGGDKRSFTQMALEYAQKGYVAIAPNYRLSREAPFPAAIEDVKCAVRWLRAHAKQYGVDPDRIGAYGNSAGAHLVALLALAGPDAGLEGDGPYQDESSAIQAAVASATPADFLAWDRRTRSWQTAVLPFLAGPDETLEERARRASPVTYARAGAPPILLIHGTSDSTVPLEQAERLLGALKRAGAKDVTLMKFDGAGHGVFREHYAETAPAMEAFFRTRLRLDGSDEGTSSRRQRRRN